jgi:mono/diheme cytochrome c family protein
MKPFIAGIISTFVAGLVVGYAAMSLGYFPANADTPPSKLETWIAHHALRATIDRLARKTANPVELNDADLLAGLKIYSLRCAFCHGAADGKSAPDARGLYQKPPELAKHGVEDDPEWMTHWKIHHGIRMTGMPSFGKVLSDTDMWKVTLFLKHMDALPPQVDKAWKAVPSQG